MTIDPKAPVYARNEILVAADVGAVWDLMASIASWPEWHAGIRVKKCPDPVREGIVFEWAIGGFGVRTRLEEFAPTARLGWSGRAFGATGRHLWTFERRGEGTLVVSEESMAGFMARVSKLLAPSFVSDSNQLWLEKLKERAERP